MWNFGDPTPWAVQSTPKHIDFFLDAESTVAEDLARELTQNSADAARDGIKNVRVGFRFGSIDRDTFRNRWLGGLRDHLVASDHKAAEVLDSEGPVPFLVVEDFGTRGLDGSYDRESPSNYNRFWWMYGESGKHGDAGGRHGVGKSTIAGSSKLKFFFGLTARADDQLTILTGQAVLRPHRLRDEHRYEAYGFFTASQPPAAPKPFFGQDAVTSDFCRDFNVVRGSDPGLSLVIPFPHEQITEESLLDAVTRHCFHQICNGMLAVQVGSTLLDQGSILQVITQRPKLQRLQAAVELSLAVAGSSPPAPICVVHEYMSDRLKASDFGAEDLVAMRSAWNEGKIIAARLPIKVEPPDAPAEIGDVLLYLRRQQDAELFAETYVRGRVTVTLKPRITTKNVVALLVTAEGIVSRFLGDAEKPNHREWIMNRAEARGYRNPRPALRVIPSALRDLHSIVSESAEATIVKDVLKEFFNTPKDRTKSNDEGPPPPPSPPSPPPPPPPEAEGLTVIKVKGGFKVTYHGTAGQKGKFIVSAVYDVRRGKPRWSPEDFDLAGKAIKVAPSGKASVERRSDLLAISEAEPGFVVSVTGFDPNRDLRVKTEMEGQDV